MTRSRKSVIIESLFEDRWNRETGRLGDPGVTLEQIARAIRGFNDGHPDTPLSDRNPANFFKDFVRNKVRANANWPRSVFRRGYAARQVTGESMCFEFTPTEPGQAVPFPVRIYAPSHATVRHRIQSASMSLASRRLGRSDEAWLIQVLVRLHVVETHLSLTSSGRFLQVELLQTNIKLARAEIDALFLAVEEPDPGASPREVLVSLEAKGARDDILEDQILAQAKAVFHMRGVRHDVVIPLAAKATGLSTVYLVQFAPLTKSQTNCLDRLIVQSEAVYELVPPVPGVGQ